MSRCRKSDKHSKECLVKSGDRQNMKYKPLIILLFFGYTLKINLAISNSYFSFSLLTFENLQNHFIVQFFNFSFWRNFANKKKAAY